MMTDVTNWSRYPRTRSEVIQVRSTDQPLPFDTTNLSFLPFGMGRSLGDSCLNDGNVLLDARGLDRILAFDEVRGRLRAEAGLTFDAILQLALPRGWFLPVTPGTRFVTLGGAIANDVHGKNHHWAGTFGRHVLEFGLRRSDGSRLRCSPGENADWFRATVGGLGLTGLIEWVEVQLKPVLNSWIDSKTTRFGDLDEFYSLNTDALARHEYIVAWVDTLTRRRPGSGVLICGGHNADRTRNDRTPPAKPRLSIPFVLPFSAVNQITLRGFNTAFYWLRPPQAAATVPLGPFFYPLDSIGAYHRIYGPRGMIQWQALVPSREAVREVLKAAAGVGGSFLSVMKVMGDEAPPGLLSFSGSGTTIALDFPYERTILDALPRLDEIVAEAGGRLYPAKDARMSAGHFRRFYPEWEELLPFIDPRFSSSFWRRVTAA